MEYDSKLAIVRICNVANRWYFQTIWRIKSFVVSLWLSQFQQLIQLVLSSQYNRVLNFVICKIWKRFSLNWYVHINIVSFLFLQRFILLCFRGIWNVPFINSCYLINASTVLQYSEEELTYKSDTVDPDMKICTSLRDLVRFIQNQRIVFIDLY